MLFTLREMAFTNASPLLLTQSSRHGTKLNGPVCTVAPSKATPPVATKPPGISGQIVNAIISVQPIWAAMRKVSRKIIAGYAERAGINWSEHVRELERLLPESERDKLLAVVTDPSLEYPSYYIAPFHAYSVGNMGWEPAFEALPATVALSYRALIASGFDANKLSPYDIAIEQRLRVFGAATELFPEFWNELKKQGKVTVADLGCGTGLSTVATHRAVKELIADDAKFDVVGIDASPHMLAVAKATVNVPGIDFRHELMEKTKFGDGSQDMYCVQFVVHEIPDIRPTLEEGYRVLRKGGMLILVDNDPESKGVKVMHPMVLTLLKSTEPYCDLWWSTDVGGVGRSVGFSECKSLMVTDRHRAYVLIK